MKHQTLGRTGRGLRRRQITDLGLQRHSNSTAKLVRNSANGCNGFLSLCLVAFVFQSTQWGCSPRSRHRNQSQASRLAEEVTVPPRCGTQPPEITSLLGRPLYAQPSDSDMSKLYEALRTAEREWEADPANPEKAVWVGRRLGYLWRMNDAIAVYTKGIARHPTYAPLYRHRGHRYISIRQFDRAIADLEKAAELIRNVPDEIEQDGAPNHRNIPLTSTAFNVWYHLGVARYLKGDNEEALRAFAETMKHTRGFDDNRVAVSDWMYLTLRRLGRHEDAAALLVPIHKDMNIIENRAYHTRLLIYKGQLDPAAALSGQSSGGLDFATLAYGVGYWHLHTGQSATAFQLFQQIVEGPYWPAFAHIAAEVELVREQARSQGLSFTR